ncbi:MAG: hypothetical protein AAF399_30400 [Bacteroidota bacterium]
MKYLCFLFLLGCQLAFSQPLIEREITLDDFRLGLSDGVQLADESWLFSSFAYPRNFADSALALVVKTDAEFRPLWSKRFKGLRNDDFSYITHLRDGHVLIGGTMRQDFSLTNGGSVFKLDTAGNILWHKLYSDSFDDRVEEIFEQADSSLIMVIRKGVTNTATKILHTTKDGDIISEYAYSFANNGLKFEAATTDGQGTYYLTGDQVDADSAYSIQFVAELTENGLQWFQRYFFGRSVSGNAITLDANGYLWLSGTITDTAAPNTQNPWLMQLNVDGSLRWAREYKRTELFTEFAGSLSPRANGSMRVYGSAFGANNSDGIAWQVDEMGVVEWTRAYNHFPFQGAGGGIPIDQGRLLVNANASGTVYLLTTTLDGENACSVGSLDFTSASLSVDVFANVPLAETVTIEVVDSMAVTVTDLPLNTDVICSQTVSNEAEIIGSIKLYPVPAGDILTVELPQHIQEEVEWRLFDVQGKLVRTSRITASANVQPTFLPHNSVKLYF